MSVWGGTLLSRKTHAQRPPRCPLGKYCIDRNTKNKHQRSIIYAYIHTYNSQDTHANIRMNTVEYQLLFSFFSSMVSTTRVDILSTTILTIFKSLISSMRIQGNIMADAQNLRKRVNFLVAFSKSRKGSLPSSFTRTCSINLTDSGICIGQTHFFDTFKYIIDMIFIITFNYRGNWFSN